MADGLIDHLEPLFSNEPAVALATLVSATGSTSKKVGTKMIVGHFYHVPTAITLAIVAGVLGISVLASVLHPQKTLT